MTRAPTPMTSNSGHASSVGSATVRPRSVSSWSAARPARSFQPVCLSPRGSSFLGAGLSNEPGPDVLLARNRAFQLT